MVINMVFVVKCLQNSLGCFHGGGPNLINDKNREKTHRTDCSGTGRVAWREKNFVFFVFKRKKSFKPRGEQNKGPK